MFERGTQSVGSGSSTRVIVAEHLQAAKSGERSASGAAMGDSNGGGPKGFKGFSDAYREWKWRLDWSYVADRRRACENFEVGDVRTAHAQVADADRRAPGLTTELFLAMLEKRDKAEERARKTLDAAKRRIGRGSRRTLMTLTSEAILRGNGSQAPAMRAIRQTQREEVALLETAVLALRDGDHASAETALRRLETIAPTAFTATLLAECYEAQGRAGHAWQWATFAGHRHPSQAYRVRARQVAERTGPTNSRVA